MLDVDDIRRRIGGIAAARLDRLEVFPEIDSTNSYLMQQPRPAPGRMRVAIAEHQTAGRGRRERSWQSPPGCGLCFSLAYTLDVPARSVPRLTLVIGVAVVDVLRDLHVNEVRLKWPNDLIADDAKLGGILTEYRSGGTVVIGIGINVDFQDSVPEAIPPGRVGRVTDLRSLSVVPPPRESLSAALVERLFANLEFFEDHGFAPFREAWQTSDWLRGRQVVVELPVGRIYGTAEGIDECGALQVRTREGMQTITSGSVFVPESEDVVA